MLLCNSRLELHFRCFEVNFFVCSQERALGQGLVHLEPSWEPGEGIFLNTKPNSMVYVTLGVIRVFLFQFCGIQNFVNLQ